MMLVYYNLMIWLIAPEILTNPLIITGLIIYYIIGTIDVMIRPLPVKTMITVVEKAIALIGLLFPFIIILAYIENMIIIVEFIPFWNELIVAYIGIVFMIIGGIIMIISRIQLGKFGTPVIHTAEGHKLGKKGLYKIVRHPMYFGASLMMLGPYFVLRSLFTLIGIVILYLYLMRIRIKMEEEVLIGAFGDEYRNYMRTTKRIIPFIF